MANPRPVNMETSLLSWLVLLTFYMLYILLGGCMFNRIEHQMEDSGDLEEAEQSREIKESCTYDISKVDSFPYPCLQSERNVSGHHICMVPKLVIVDLLAQVLQRSPTNITSVLNRLRDLSTPNNTKLSSSKPSTIKVKGNCVTLILRDKMNCTVKFGNCFLRVALMYQLCCLVARCQGKLRELTKTFHKTYCIVDFVSYSINILGCFAPYLFI